MMDNELNDVNSHRAVRLAEKFHNKEYRDTYVESHTRRFLAHQMRKFRGEKSQVEFGDILNKRQTIVWRLEDPNYSGWSLRTLFQVAQTLNVAVVARFVDFQTFLRFTDDTSESALNPGSYDEARVDEFALDEEAAREQAACQSLYVNPWQANQGITGIVGFPSVAPAGVSVSQTFASKVGYYTSINGHTSEIFALRQQLAEKDKEIASLRAANNAANEPVGPVRTREQMLPIGRLAQELRIGAL